VGINNGDLIVVSSSTGGCFILYQFKYSLGIDELFNHNNKDARIFDILGREIKNPIPGKLYIQRGKKFIK
jgi:hypothetical protein